MTTQQRKVLAVMIACMVAGVVYLGVKTNRRKLEEMQRKRVQKLKAAVSKRRTKPVVFAKENIKKRTEIRKEWLEVKQVEERDVPRSAYASAIDQVVGKIALVNIYMGEPLIKNRFTDKDQVTALSFIIKKGMRAVSLNINTVNACGGFLKQGDKVDILATFNLNLDPSGHRNTLVTSYLLRNVTVLAIDNFYKLNKDQQGDSSAQQQQNNGQNNQQGINPYQARANVSMVTFLVSPEDAEKLVIAGQKARLKLVLTPENAGAAKDVLQELVITDQALQSKRTHVSSGKKKEKEQVKVELLEGSRKREMYLKATPPPPEPGPDASLTEPLEEPKDWDATGDDDMVGVSLPSAGP